MARIGGVRERCCAKDDARGASCACFELQQFPLKLDIVEGFAFSFHGNDLSAGSQFHSRVLNGHGIDRRLGIQQCQQLGGQGISPCDIIGGGHG